MKKLIIILLLIVFSCEDALNVPIRSNIVTENFFKTESDFDLALAGVYDVLGNHQEGSGFGTYFRGLMVMGRAGTDEGFAVPTFQQYGVEISNYTFTSQSQLPLEVWEAQYRGIGRANTLLSRLNAVSDQLDIAQPDLDRIIGETKFLRAFYYFQLVRFYGGVPLVTEEITDVDQLDLTRKSIAEVYAQIIQDFSDAEDLLPIDNTNGRAEKYAAKAFLSKVYLQMSGAPLNDTSKATLAALKAQDVIENGPYSLLPNYSDVFQLEDEYHSEYIFNVSFMFCGNCEGGQVGTWDGPPGLPYYTIFRSFQENYDSYDPSGDDLRRDYSIIDYQVTGFDPETGDATTGPLSEGNTFAFKWRHDPNPLERPNGKLEWQSPFDFPLLRYADVLLTYAEAKLREGGSLDALAISAINEVRFRAYGVTGDALRNSLIKERITDADPALTPAEETAELEQIDLDVPVIKADRQAMIEISTPGYTLDDILFERKWELSFEGHRWHDLVRFDKLLENVQAITSPQSIFFSKAANNISSRNLLFPIPQQEIQLSRGVMTQNPGY